MFWAWMLWDPDFQKGFNISTRQTDKEIRASVQAPDEPGAKMFEIFAHILIGSILSLVTSHPLAFLDKPSKPTAKSLGRTSVGSYTRSDLQWLPDNFDFSFVPKRKVGFVVSLQFCTQFTAPARHPRDSFIKDT